MNDDEIECRIEHALDLGNFNEAEVLLESLAERNSEYALLTLGWLHETGVAGRSNIELARTNFNKAIRLGYKDAYRRLGWLELNEENFDKAREIFKAGSEIGSMACMYKFGTMLHEGKGGAVEIQKSLSLLRDAAKKGHIYSQRKLYLIQASQTRNPIKKISAILKMIMLSVKYGIEYRKDKSSEKVIY